VPVPPIDPRRAQVMDLLRVVSRQMVQIAHDVAVAMGLHQTDMLAIMDVADLTEHHGRPPTIGELGDAAGLSSAAATTLVDRLEHAGYVERVRDTRDRRRVHLQLTPKHHDAAAPMLWTYLERLSTALDACDDDDLDGAARVLAAVRDAADAPPHAAP
jgi:DNA-binding MarR family transcriptional regulator